MSDDDTGGWAPNIGVTLPDNENATYNSALSPIFIWQGGHTELDNLHIARRGSEGRYWTQTAYSEAAAYIVYFNLSTFEANSSGVRQVARSLRCLVSTNNRIIIKEAKDSAYLVSDDEKGNGGVTLPGTANATYNISLSPLFFGYFGRVYDYVVGNAWVKVATGRGNIGIFRAATAAQLNDTAYRLWIGIHTLSPSDQNSRAWALSLRCLVSTNNR